MKYVLFVVGVVLGAIIAPMITDANFLQWLIRLGLGILGYNIPLFISYTRMSPKKLLAFHGKDSPIMRSNSLGELQTFMHQLKKGGLLINIIPHQTALVNKMKWDELTDSEKLCFSKIAAQFFKLNTGNGEVEIKSMDQNCLATYSPSKGFETTQNG